MKNPLSTILKTIKDRFLEKDMIKKKYEFFLNPSLLPPDFEYPEQYLKYIETIEQVFEELDPWHFFYSMLEYRYKGLQKRYPHRKLIPFARRNDNDDVACFDASESNSNPKVLLIHDFASAGYEKRGEFKDFNSWVEFAKEEARDWRLYWATRRKK